MINHNGIISHQDNTRLEHFNRGFLYGDGVFETLKVVNNKILFWEDHYFRLMASMRILRMEIPMEFTPEFLEEQLKSTIEASGLSNSTCRIRITVYRSGGGAYLPEERRVGYSIFAKEHSSPFYTISQEPYEVELYKDHYVNPDLLSTLKTTNKILNVTGSIWAKENGYDNCLLMRPCKVISFL